MKLPTMTVVNMINVSGANVFIAFFWSITPIIYVLFELVRKIQAYRDHGDKTQGCHNCIRVNSNGSCSHVYGLVTNNIKNKTRPAACDGWRGRNR